MGLNDAAVATCLSACHLAPHPPAPCPPPSRFLRFPGGCYVEGDWLRAAFRWKTTLGGNEERPGHFNRWRQAGRRARMHACSGPPCTGTPSNAATHVDMRCCSLPPLPPCLPRPPCSMWGYWSTDGLGLFEYLLLAEELGAQPIWVVNNGGAVCVWVGRCVCEGGWALAVV